MRAIRSSAAGSRSKSVPFRTQDRFDRLLWRSDVNFVRGEDSFVRAQWAAQPFVWQPYPQDDDAHRLKLDAFLTRFCAELATDASRCRPRASGMRSMQKTVRQRRRRGRRCAAHMRALEVHGRHWAATLATLPELTAGLVDFARPSAIITGYPHYARARRPCTARLSRNPP